MKRERVGGTKPGIQILYSFCVWNEIGFHPVHVLSLRRLKQSTQVVEERRTDQQVQIASSASLRRNDKCAG